MKKYLLSAALLAMAAQSSFAADFNVDGIYYNKNTDNPTECSVAKSYTYKGKIVIPSTVTYEGTTYSVTAIGEKAFLETDITSVTIPASIKSIERDAFGDCRNLTELTIEDSDEPMDVSYYDGGFSFSGMWSKTELTSLYLGRNLNYEADEELGYSPFNQCFYLTNIEFGPKITTITPHLFRECIELRTVNITNGVTTIDDYAFAWCDITKVNISANVSKIGAGAFEGCIYLKNLDIDPANPYYSAKDMVLFSADGKELVLYLSSKTNTTYTVPAGTERIGGGAFGGADKLQKITVSEGVVEIGDGAFGSIQSLVEVNLPQSLKKVGSNAFYNCRSLPEITFPEGCTEFGSGVLSYCASLSSVNLPKTLTAVPDAMVAGCNTLETIDLPESVTSIGNEAFFGCPNLKSISASGKITRIGDSAFENCISLSSYDFNDGLVEIGAKAFESVPLKELKLPATVENVGRRAFAYTDISTIELSPKMTVIKDDLFLNCMQLKEFTIPDHIEIVEEWAFAQCENLKSVTIGKGVKRMDNQVFNICGSLENVVFEDAPEPLDLSWGGLTIQHAQFFYTCPVKEAYVGRDLVNDENLGAFMATEELEKVTFGDMVKKVQTNGMLGCENLKEVTLGKSVSEIGENAFRLCTSIQTINSLNMTAPAGAKFEQSVYQNATLTIPYGSLDSYAAADGWREFINIVETDKPQGAIDQIEADVDLFTTAGGAIEFAPGVNGHIFSIHGVEMPAGCILPSGIYIVMIDGKSTKVVM